MDRDRKRILLVEDDGDTREMVGELLELLGHEVHTAGTGADAVRAVAGRDADAAFDVALVDIGLPDLSGHEVAVRMRSVSPRRELRIVALSGRSQPADIARSLASGMELHLVKPAGYEDLRRVVGIASAPPRDVGWRTIRESCATSRESSSSTTCACSVVTKAKTGPHVFPQMTSPT
jgi:CheY-like chemotaxis protein